MIDIKQEWPCVNNCWNRVTDAWGLYYATSILKYICSFPIIKWENKNVVQYHLASILVIYCLIANYPKFQQLNNTHLLSLSSWGSGSGHSFSGCFWFRVSHKLQCAAQGLVISRLSCTGRDPLEAHAYQCLWLLVEISALCHMSFSIVLLTAGQLASSNVRALRENLRNGMPFLLPYSMH